MLRQEIGQVSPTGASSSGDKRVKINGSTPISQRIIKKGDQVVIRGTRGGEVTMAVKKVSMSGKTLTLTDGREITLDKIIR